MDSPLGDIRYAARTLAKSPGFTTAAVLTLALGIGANTAMFSVIDGVLLRPAPVEDLDQLVMVWETDRHSGTTREPASVPDYVDFRRQATTFEELAAFAGGDAVLTAEGAEPVRLPAMAVTREFLPLLGLEPIVGRNFTSEEDAPGGPAVALISEDFWLSRLARAPDVLGRTVRINDVPRTIVGVLPSGADFGALQILGRAAYSRGFADRATAEGVGVWVPLRPDPERTPRSTHPIFVVGRLRPGVAPAVAHREMEAMTAELERLYPENDGRGAFVEPLREVVFGRVRAPLLVLLAAVVLVLLAACANVANLLLARGVARAREVAVRVALGARPPRLARQFLAEGLVLAGLGGLLGVLIAFWGLDLLLALAPHDLPRRAGIGLDLRVLAATAAASALVGLGFGLVPLLQASRLEIQPAVGAGGGRGESAGRERRRLRSALIATEVALAVPLVVGAGLLMRSFWRLTAVDPGFRAQGVLKAEFQLPATRYPRDSSVWPRWVEMDRFNQSLLSRVAALPGVEAAAVAGNHPLDPGFTNSFVVVGREAEAETWPEISIRRVTPNYFRTLGLPVLEGRSLADGDDASAPPVLLINGEARRRFFANAPAIGAEIAFWGSERRVVGVVADERIHGLAETAPPAVYLPLVQAPSANGGESLLLRVQGDPESLVPALRAAVRAIDPELAVFGVEALEQTVSRSVHERRFTVVLLGLFAGLALALSAIGTYGILAYAVTQRRREIGIRMAVGAGASDVLRLVVREAAGLTAVGLLVGVGAALALSSVLSGLLYGVSALDPVTFLAVPLVVTAVALLASYLPARRAASVDPMMALRNE